MKGEFSFEINDHVLDSLMYLIESEKKEKEFMAKCVLTTGEEKTFKLNKIMYKPKIYKKRKGGKYKHFIIPTKEVFFEGVLINADENI